MRGDVAPDVKALVCKYIKQCGGDFNCVFSGLNHARKGGGPPGSPADPRTWNDPLLRNAENFATAASTNSGIDINYGSYTGLTHTAVGITGYQFFIKPVLYPIVGKPSSPVSVDAWNAGLAGGYWYKRGDPAAALKWCEEKGCEK